MPEFLAAEAAEDNATGLYYLPLEAIPAVMSLLYGRQTVFIRSFLHTTPPKSLKYLLLMHEIPEVASSLTHSASYGFPQKSHTLNTVIIAPVV